MAGDHGMRRRLEAAVTAHDRKAAVAAALESVHAGVPLLEVYDQLARLLAEVGDAWYAGTKEVWQEHLATAVARTVVEACAPLVDEQAAPPLGLSVVLATPPEEHHDLGLRMLADAFTLAGWEAHLLGASVPVDQLVAAAQALRADGVALSAATHFHRVALREYVAKATARLPNLPIWVGGAAFARSREAWSLTRLIGLRDVAGLAVQVRG